jgi:hypothetical protein
VPDLATKTPSDLIHFFVYFLTVVKGQDAATGVQVARCFDAARLTKYSNIPAYLSRNSQRRRGQSPPFLRTHGGYQLVRGRETALGAVLQTGPARTQTTATLDALMHQLTDREEMAFLQEARDCYAIDARRAAIVLVWILTVHHLYRYILIRKKTEFNAALAKVTDKRVKVTSVAAVDDFGDIPENIFIELARSSGVISNDVRKILDVKLGIRNTSAHPSAVLISQVKTTDFIIDLIQNVILKYTV